MNTILRQWNVMRAIKLLLGLVILVQGIATREIISIAFGVIIAGMAVANRGCCGTPGCEVDSQRQTKPDE